MLTEHDNIVALYQLLLLAFEIVYSSCLCSFYQRDSRRKIYCHHAVRIVVPTVAKRLQQSLAGCLINVAHIGKGSVIRILSHRDFFGPITAMIQGVNPSDLPSVTTYI